MVFYFFLCAVSPLRLGRYTQAGRKFANLFCANKKLLPIKKSTKMCLQTCEELHAGRYA